MQANKSNSFKKIFSELSKVSPSAKKVIKIGAILCLGLLVLGGALIVVSRYSRGYDSYMEFLAGSIIKSSFTILAEVIIGSLIVDYVFGRG